MQSDNQKVIDEMLKSFSFLLTNAVKQTTHSYDALIVSSNTDGTWNLRFNGEVHAIPPYGPVSPAVGKMVKVIIPQGNLNLAYFF